MEKWQIMMYLWRTAQKKLDRLIEFLEEEWSEKIKQEFVIKLDNSIRIIKSQPEAFPESNLRKGLRKCVITKQTTLYYRYNSRKIFLVTLFDTRQDLNKINREI